MSEELKPCPFCGGEMHLIGDMSDPKRAKLYRSQCKRCGCDLGGFLTEGLAIAAWNRRATPSPDSAAGEVVKDPHFIRRHGAFFRDGAHGYCTDIAGAGVFSLEDARRYLDVEGLTIHPVREYEVEIGLILNAADRLRAALAADASREGG